MATTDELLIDAVLQFWEVCVHSALYTLHLYPAALFEERIHYGVPVMQNRHPEVREYVQKVLENAQPLVAAGLAETLLLQVLLPSGLPAYQVSLAAELGSLAAPTPALSSSTHAASCASSTSISTAAAQELHEELRGSLLKLNLSLARLPPPVAEAPQAAAACTWALGLVTRASPKDDRLASKAEAAMAQALQSGSWLADNQLLPERYSRQQEQQGQEQAWAGGGSSGSSNSNSSSGSGSRVVAVKSFTAGGISSSIYVHLHV